MEITVLLAYFPLSQFFLEKVVCNQLMEYPQQDDTLCPDQYGFQLHSQTTHALHKLLNIISENAINNHVTVVTFLDLSKAFDCLQYDKLFFKLDKLGFSEHTLKWLKSFLSNRTQVVNLNGTVPHQLDMSLGVPQGSILGPILFLLYVNDINNCDTSAKFVKFANDTTVITTAPTLQEASWKMNVTMDKVFKWFQSNKLNLNPSKTRYMNFNCKGNTEINHVHINGVNIEREFVNKARKNNLS